jgi:hypothetical protein
MRQVLRAEEGKREENKDCRQLTVHTVQGQRVFSGPLACVALVVGPVPLLPSVVGAALQLGGPQQAIQLLPV